MKIVVAPDSFKESLSAVEVARAIARGIKEAIPRAEIDFCPMADGGEGTVEAMVSATAGEFRFAQVTGPLGEKTKARFGLLGDGKTAVIEMAEAAGLALIEPDRRNPLETTTFGVGQIMVAAMDAGAEKMVIGIGGSATVDGGVGCAQALGVIFIDDKGKALPCGLAGGDLSKIARIDLSDRDPRLVGSEIKVACDVTNPLTGPDGAAAVFGPQKGATPEMVELLDSGLAHLAGIIKRDLGMDVADVPGAGAAGGLGAGLVAFAGAKLDRGIDIVAEAVGLSERLNGADLVITGEGKFDSQTAAGKTAIGVADVARAGGIPCICIPGQAEPDAPFERFTAVYPLMSGEVCLEDALERPAELLAMRARQAIENLSHRPGKPGKR